ncbi:MAG: phosphotransferase family protein [Chloroflexi bacterium]|nr:phosphotransferase family protein [Chloroflexota bacterium]
MALTSPSDSPDPKWIDQPASVRAGEALDPAQLESYLREHLPGVGGPLTIQQFPGGYSNLTYLLRAGGHELVLRRPPFGANIKGGHDMGREYRILAALHPAYHKVPKPLAYCEDVSVIGAPFYVMERVRGVILRNNTPEGLTLEPSLMRRLCFSLIETLADLHRLDYVAAGLGDLGKPQGYVERQVEGWTKRYANAQTDDIAEMEQVGVWLAANRPPDSAPALIHNDFRCDNVLLDPADLTRPVALLDWEMATIGDPLMDVGTTLAYWAEAGAPAVMQDFSLVGRPGFINRQEFIERYASQSGRDLSNILFYYVCGLFKLGVIVQQIYARYKKGLTHDERFRPLIFVVRACGQMAARAIEKNRLYRLSE